MVVDASMAASWIIPDEASQHTESVFRRLKLEHGVAPTLFWFEVRQLLLTAERRNRLGQGEAIAGAQNIANLPIDDAGRGLDASVIRLAAKHSLSAYDASYLSIAIAGNTSLATLDKRLAAAAHAEQILVLGPLRQT